MKITLLEYFQNLLRKEEVDEPSRTAKLGVHFKYFVERSHNKQQQQQQQQHMTQNRRTSCGLHCSDGKDMTRNVYDSSYKTCCLPAATSEDRMHVEDFKKHLDSFYTKDKPHIKVQTYGQTTSCLMSHCLKSTITLTEKDGRITKAWLLDLSFR